MTDAAAGTVTVTSVLGSVTSEVGNKAAVAPIEAWTSEFDIEIWAETQARFAQL